MEGSGWIVIRSDVRNTTYNTRYVLRRPKSHRVGVALVGNSVSVAALGSVLLNAQRGVSDRHCAVAFGFGNEPNCMVTVGGICLFVFLLFLGGFDFLAFGSGLFSFLLWYFASRS